MRRTGGRRSKNPYPRDRAGLSRRAPPHRPHPRRTHRASPSPSRSPHTAPPSPPPNQIAFRAPRPGGTVADADRQGPRSDWGYVLLPLAAPHHRRDGLVFGRPFHQGASNSGPLPAAVDATTACPISDRGLRGASKVNAITSGMPFQVEFRNVAGEAAAIGMKPSGQFPE